MLLLLLGTSFEVCYHCCCCRVRSKNFTRDGRRQKWAVVVVDDVIFVVVVEATAEVVIKALPGACLEKLFRTVNYVATVSNNIFGVSQIIYKLCLKVGHSPTLLALFSSFITEALFTVNTNSVNDWIRITDIWFRKRLLCQLCHNH